MCTADDLRFVDHRYSSILADRVRRRPLGQHRDENDALISTAACLSFSSLPCAQPFRNKSGTGFKLILLSLIVLQNTLVVLGVRYTRTSVAKDDLYDVNHLVLTTEIAKFILSCLLETQTHKDEGGGGLARSLQTHILNSPLDFLKILIPALLYLLTNTLIYTALSNLSAPLFAVTYQSKILTTAIVSCLLLNRRYTVQQWLCLLALGGGVAVVVLAEETEAADAKAPVTVDSTHQNLTLGLAAVTVGCFSSALAGVYFEKVIKTKKDPGNDGGAEGAGPSLWMRNIQMAFFSVIIALARNRGSASEKPLLHGFTGWVWGIVALQAGGGLLVAATIKYADNVLKGFALAVAVVVSTALSVNVFGTHLSIMFYPGSLVILGSVYIFSNPVTFWVNKKDDHEELDSEPEPEDKIKVVVLRS